MRALVLRPGSWTAEVVQVDGRALDTFQRLVGGFIEGLTLTPSLSAYINEEGKLIGLPANAAGDRLIRRALHDDGRMLMPGDVIVGPVVLVGSPDEEGWDTDVPDSALRLCESLGITVEGEHNGTE